MIKTITKARNDSKQKIVNKYMSGKVNKFETIEKIYGGKISFDLNEKENNELRKNGYGDLVDMMML